MTGHDTTRTEAANVRPCDVLSLGVALPFAVRASPAYAVVELDITKTHEGDFARGGQGVYTITVTNSGNEDALNVEVRDVLPEGLTLSGVEWTD
ncbi:DUF11 domain-containing protein [Streptomyces flavochromogenes]|uniref:DUF11 domain-containing protein n=1 Tax=Streptomyces flavochromogenes TaxID=68199 RepID=A0ABW6XZF9_9ACTN|nr:DUF11 domain-containing protein [Streptomyces flavochromogenes]